MKKILALLLAAMMVLSLAACGGETPNENENTLQSEESETAKHNEPYRGIVYGMSAEDVKTLEKGLSSTFIEGDEERLLYEALVENDIVRVMYLFENEVLAHLEIFLSVGHLKRGVSENRNTARALDDVDTVARFQIIISSSDDLLRFLAVGERIGEVRSEEFRVVLRKEVYSSF